MLGWLNKRDTAVGRTILVMTNFVAGSGLKAEVNKHTFVSQEDQRAQVNCDSNVSGVWSRNLSNGRISIRRVHVWVSTVQRLDCSGRLSGLPTGQRLPSLCFLVCKFTWSFFHHSPSISLTLEASSLVVCHFFDRQRRDFPYSPLPSMTCRLYGLPDVH